MAKQLQSLPGSYCLISCCQGTPFDGVISCSNAYFVKGDNWIYWTDIVYISMIVEGGILDIDKVNVLFSTSNLRVNVA